MFICLNINIISTEWSVKNSIIFFYINVIEVPLNSHEQITIFMLLKSTETPHKNRKKKTNKTLTHVKRTSIYIFYIGLPGCIIQIIHKLYVHLHHYGIITVIHQILLHSRHCQFESKYCKSSWNPFQHNQRWGKANTERERCAYTPVTLERPGVNLSLSNYDVYNSRLMDY